jgi:hypothetical protein
VKESTPAAALFAIPPLSLLPVELLVRLWGPVCQVVQLICRFRGSDPTPRLAYDFERQLSELLREVGRVIVECLYNDCEPPSRDRLPTQIRCGGVWYQRNGCKTANRKVASLFGTITLMRFLYRPIGDLVPSIFPLEIRLGLELGRATPALAERVGICAAQCTQQQVLQILLRDHGVKWSVAVLRDVTAAVAAGLSEHRHEAQVAKLLELLKMASASRGNRRPILAVGRDGIFIPIRKESCYREGAVATVSIFDRCGQRLGSVYLGRMPEEGQPTLSDQLTSLITEVLKQWTGPMPRLVYVTDAGNHQTEYYKKILRRMTDPRSPHRRLHWEWVLDYFHACEYISKLAEALFGEGREAQAWAAKMRQWLKQKPKGIHRVLHSAAAVKKRRGLRGSSGAYNKAYRYLSRRIAYLDYHGYRKAHLPIGSGVTEACCKTLFTQRMKQSGMSWHIESGQAIVDLRVAHLSQTWKTMFDAYLGSKDDETMRTQLKNHRFPKENAA